MRKRLLALVAALLACCLPGRYLPFCGLLLQWVRNGMEEEPAELVDRMGKLGKGGLGRGLDVFSNGR